MLLAETNARLLGDPAAISSITTTAMANQNAGRLSVSAIGTGLVETSNDSNHLTCVQARVGQVRTTVANKIGRIRIKVAFCTSERFTHAPFLVQAGRSKACTWQQRLSWIQSTQVKYIRLGEKKGARDLTAVAARPAMY
jgi:hypothetical protein